MDRGSPRRTPVRRARTSAPGAQGSAPSAAGGGLFANVERDADNALQLPFAPQHRGGLDSGLAKACPSSEGLTQKTYTGATDEGWSCFSKVVRLL